MNGARIGSSNPALIHCPRRRKLWVTLACWLVSGALLLGFAAMVATACIAVQ